MDARVDNSSSVSSSFLIILSVRSVFSWTKNSISTTSHVYLLLIHPGDRVCPSTSLLLLSRINWKCLTPLQTPTPVLFIHFSTMNGEIYIPNRYFFYLILILLLRYWFCRISHSHQSPHLPQFSVMNSVPRTAIIPCSCAGGASSCSYSWISLTLRWLL